MSKTKFVSFGDKGFWAYDVALGVFLKYLIDAAEKNEQVVTPWLSQAVSDWRVMACIQDFGEPLKVGWSASQRQAFVAFAEEACTNLANRESIPASEIVSWPIFEDDRIFTRGATEVHTGPVVELGRAMIALVRGELPDAPKGEIWLYGTPEGLTTLGIRQ
jgi:hypothetical protein